MIVCCVMILAICSPVFAADATVDTEIPNMTDEEINALREHEHAAVKSADLYPCPNCPADKDVFFTYKLHNKKFCKNYT